MFCLPEKLDSSLNLPKVKMVSDLIGGNFTNVASETIFTFGRFKLESNFSGKQNIDYSNELSSFVKPITLEDLDLSEIESNAIFDFSNNASLIFDRSDLRNFVKFGSTRELLRVSIEQILSKYPASLFVNNRKNIDLNITFLDFTYDPLTDVSQFNIPATYIDNPYGLVFNINNTESPDGNELRNLNLSFFKYVIWRKDDPTNNQNYIIGFTGDSVNNPYVTVQVQGNPFPDASGATGTLPYHLKPEPLEYNKFRAELEDIERYLIGDRQDNQNGFLVYFKEPTLLETGEIIYTDRRFTWTTTDGYNLDFRGSRYTTFLQSLLNVGSKYDEVKTDLIARFLVPASIKTYDLTDEGKMTKLLRIYGREFDNVRQFIDSLVNINTVTYNKKRDVPTQLVKNLAKTLGWDVFTIIDAEQFSESFFSTEEEQEENTLLPAEVDIELWRRIIINTNYFWKSKGTRHALKAMLLLIGIPEPFVNITEYVYTVDGKINPNTVALTIDDLPSASLPYDSNGYPRAPKETNDFYFQISGNTDGGQAYMDNFRNVGFTLNRTVDNKKSWSQSGFTERIHYTTPNYFQEDSKLVLNTKEIDATLDIARAIEYDVFCYIQSIDPFVNSGYTKPYIYINVPFEYGTSAHTFTIPDIPLTGSAIQLNFNGITLTEASGSTATNGDYYRVDDTTIALIDPANAAKTYSSGEKDVITLTYIHDKLGSSGYTEVKYIVQMPTVSVDGTTIDLGEEPKGDVQLVVDGMTLSKGTSLYTGDFVIDSNDRTKIIVKNNILKQYLQSNPVLRIWYIKDGGSATNAEKRSEILRVDSLSSMKLRYEPLINRYIYTLDYLAFDGDSIKITLNGITLQNETDFVLNTLNKAEVILKSTINLGDILGAYYVVEDDSFSPPILPPDPVYSDIQNMSFLEFLELVNRRLINVRNRKTITDNKGGWYPTVLKLYEEYLLRSFRPEGDPLKSNGYTFQIVYPFIERYSSFFSRFVDQLLPATIIQRKSGVLIRNTIFTKQKYVYKRGVNFNESLGYLGNDGSEFIIEQSGTTS
jgi:hypothetical protein